MQGFFLPYIMNIRISAYYFIFKEIDMEIVIGKRMRELRLQKKNTQEQLAAHLGITIQAVSKWERGVSRN